MMKIGRIIIALVVAMLPCMVYAADLTIDQLNAANPLSGTESVPIFQGINPAVKTTTQGIANLAISATNLTTGTLPAGRLPALTGDITSSAGSNVTTLSSGSASVLNSGILPSSRIVGAYTGITQVGTLTAGSIPTSLLTYTAAGTGGTLRTQSSKNADIISVIDYGADPSGLVNATPAIRNALTAAGVNGMVYFPCGSYLISSNLNLNSGAQHLIGAGVDCVFLQLDSGVNDDLLTFGNGSSSSNGTNSSVEHMTLSGNYTLQTAGSVIKVNGSGDVRINDVHLKLCHDSCINITGSVTAYGGAWVTRAKIETWFSGYGINFDTYAGGTRITNSDFSSSANGTASAAIRCLNTSDLEIVGNNIDPDIGRGITVDGCSSVVIVGNFLHSMAQYGVDVVNASKDITITGNTFYAFGGAGSNAGVRIAASTHSVVSGNSFDSTGAQGGNPGYGILESAASDYNAIAVNTLAGGYAGAACVFIGVNSKTGLNVGC